MLDKDTIPQPSALSRTDAMPNPSDSQMHSSVPVFNTRRLGGEFLRTVVAGGIATVVDFAVLVALASGIGWHYLLANTVSFLTGNAVNYFLNVNWVFRGHRLGNKTTGFVIFGILGAVGLGFSQVCMYLLVQYAALHYTLAKAVAVSLTLFLNFGLRKLILFRS